MNILKVFVVGCLIFAGVSCSSSETGEQPEPHLELGQKISFVGGSPDKTYLLAGYRNEFEDKTAKVWNKQVYIVFTYFNDEGGFEQGVIHKNAIIK